MKEQILNKEIFVKNCIMNTIVFKKTIAESSIDILEQSIELSNKHNINMFIVNNFKVTYL